MAREIKLDLPPIDDLFSTQEERDDAKREKVIDIPLSEIDSFPDHPFQVRMDEEMQTMADRELSTNNIDIMFQVL